MDSFGGVCPSMHAAAAGAVQGEGGQIMSNNHHHQEAEESFLDKFCLAHPQKKTKYFCENDQIYICSKCVVGDHKGHRVSDNLKESGIKIDPLQKKKNILVKKIEASLKETEMFEDHIEEIEEQLE